MRCSGTQKLAEESHRIYIRGGLQAVFEWKLNRYRQSAATHFVLPIESPKSMLDSNARRRLFATSNWLADNTRPLSHTCKAIQISILCIPIRATVLS
jgi:hypothetical protein